MGSELCRGDERWEISWDHGGETQKIFWLGLPGGRDRDVEEVEF